MGFCDLLRAQLWLALLSPYNEPYATLDRSEAAATIEERIVSIDQVKLCVGHSNPQPYLSAYIPPPLKLILADMKPSCRRDSP